MGKSVINIKDNDLLRRALTKPRSVALIGASDNIKKLTARPMSFMQKHGAKVHIYPVNPVRESVMGLKAYPSVKAIPEQIEHAYIMLNAEPALAAFQECAEAGVKVVSVLADGFAESGEEGMERQKHLVAMADEAGILLIGPNSTGVVDTREAFSCTTNAAFAADELPAGRFAVISQSGSLIGTVFSRGKARGIGFSTLISVGNEAQSGVGELGQLLVEDPEIEGFLLFMETLRNTDQIREFAHRAYALNKPVIAYMIGRSDEGQALSVSHTGALTGGAEAIDAFLKQCGIHRVDTFETFLEAPSALVGGRRAKRRPSSVTVLSTTGGGGAMVVDRLGSLQLPIVGISEESRAHLEAQDIPLGHGKLVDVTLAGANYDTMKEVISTLIRDPQTGVLVVAIGSSAQFNPELSVRPIIDAVQEAGESAAPVLAFPLPQADQSIALLIDAGIPAFRSVESCAESVAMLLSHLAPQEQPQAVLPRDIDGMLTASAGVVMNEVEAASVFNALGVAVPANLYLGPAEPLPAELPVQFPVVVKLVSRDLPHKTEMGAIRVGIKTREELEHALGELKAQVVQRAPNANVEGVLIQQMCKGLGEVLVGLTRDPLVGPCITVGLGGVLTEIYKDVAVRPAPISVDAALVMFDEIKGFALLRGFRGAPKGDLQALAQAVSAISMLAASGQVGEAEINPLLVLEEGMGVVLLDALIRVADTPAQRS